MFAHSECRTFKPRHLWYQKLLIAKYVASCNWGQLVANLPLCVCFKTNRCKSPKKPVFCLSTLPHESLRRCRGRSNTRSATSLPLTPWCPTVRPSLRNPTRPAWPSLPMRKIAPWQIWSKYFGRVKKSGVFCTTSRTLATATCVFIVCLFVAKAVFEGLDCKNYYLHIFLLMPFLLRAFHGHVTWEF